METGSSDAIDFQRVNRICSFCATPGGPDVILAGGLGAMICHVCVAGIHESNASPARIAAETRPPWDDMTDTEILATLPLILRSAEQNVRFAHEWVDLLRERKTSWAEIGKVLGVSRQAAWERFAGKASKSHPA